MQLIRQFVLFQLEVAMNKQLAIGALITVVSKLSRVADYWNTHMLDLNETEDDLLRMVEVSTKNLVDYETVMKDRMV